MPRSYHTKIGDRFGTRVVTGFLKERDTDGHLCIAWRCDCGATGTGGLKAFRFTRNCVKCAPKPGFGDQITHGHGIRGKRTHLYDCWANMMQRCHGMGSPANKRWYSGVKVCPEWQKFAGFRDWALANGHAPGLSLDRIFSRRDYEPGNCEWVTRSENSRRAAEDRWRRYDHTPIEMLWGET